ncbi:tensin-3-like isoform X5 [Tachypleus tridentatus]|uniref:tensin-3-like isoform X5 n=2 Tax=Tachypleus tridentatus TaxID=6853 RepID=UPI003FCF475E
MFNSCWCSNHNKSKKICHHHPTDFLISHSFKTKVLRRTRLCDYCRQAIPRKGSCCRVCKYTCHKKCEIKVIATCEPPPAKHELQTEESTRSLLPNPQRPEDPDVRNFSVIPSPRTPEKLPRFIMDITYITERIIVLTFPESGTDATYRSNLKEAACMLQTKHGDKYVVEDCGWPSGLAPELDKLYNICDVLDKWLRSDAQHIIVLHSKGDTGRVGIVIAAYMHHSNKYASSEQALDRFAMKRLYDYKFSERMHPSQKRYVQYFSGLLTSMIRTNKDVVYLHNIIICGIPSFESKGYRPFVKIYQRMKLVYTSKVHITTEQSQKATITIHPCLPLCGDIFIKCYHRQQKPSGRSTVFRVQFHTWTLDQKHVVFLKHELDDAISDFRFPSDGKVELQFSFHPNDFKGNGSVHKPVTASNFSDSIVRWDSYENFNMESLNAVEVHHTQGPLDGSLYATVKKNSATKNVSKKHEDIKHEECSQPNGSQAVSRNTGISSSSDFHGYCSPVHGGSQTQTPGLINGQSNEPSVNIVEAEIHGPQAKTEKAVKQSESISALQQAELDELMRSLIQETECFSDQQSPKCVQPESYISCSSAFTSSAYTDKHNLSNAEQCHYHCSSDTEENLNSTYANETTWAYSSMVLENACTLPSRDYLRNSSDFLSPSSFCSSAKILPSEVRTIDKPYVSSLDFSLSSLRPSRPLVPKDNTWLQQQWHKYLLKQEEHRKQERILREQRVIAELKDVQAKKFQLLSPSKLNKQTSPTVTWKFSPSQKFHKDQHFFNCTNNVESSNTYDSSNTLGKKVESDGSFQVAQTFSPSKSNKHEVEQVRHQHSEDNSSLITCAQIINNPVQKDFYPGASNGFDERDCNRDSETTEPFSNCNELGFQINSSPLFSGNYHKNYHIDSTHTAVNKNFALESEAVNHADQQFNQELNIVNGHGQNFFCCSLQKRVTNRLRQHDHPNSTQQAMANGFEQYDYKTSPWQLRSDPSDPQHYQSNFMASDSEQGSGYTLSRVNVSNQLSNPLISKSVHQENSELCYTIPVGSRLPNTVRTVSPTRQPCTTNHNIVSYSVAVNGPSISQAATIQFSSLSPKHGLSQHNHISSQSQSSSARPDQQSKFPSSPPALLRDPASSEFQSPKLTLFEKIPLKKTQYQTFYNQSTPQNTDTMKERTSLWSPSLVSSSSSPAFSSISVSPKAINVEQELEYTSPTSCFIPKSSTFPGMENGDLSLQQTSPILSGHSSPSQYLDQSCQSSMISLSDFHEVTYQLPFFVKDTSRYWYKPNLSRDKASRMLKDKPSGSFLVRNSHTFPGHFGLVMKIPSSLSPDIKAECGEPDPSKLVRHFLIECTSKGVRLKGCPNEPVFGSLSALIYQHSITALSLSCRLLLPELEPISETTSHCESNQGKKLDGSKVLYLNTMDTETLTGPQAVQRVVSELLEANHPAALVVVHFGVSDKGITITDTSRKLFFRRHYPVCNISYCGFDPDSRCWTKEDVVGVIPVSSRLPVTVVVSLSSCHLNKRNNCYFLANKIHYMLIVTIFFLGCSGRKCYVIVVKYFGSRTHP